MATQISAMPECLPEMVNRIVQRFDPLRIVLFGSWARGDAKPDSDVDLLVVLPHVKNKRKVTISIGNTLSDLRVSKDIIVTTPDDIAMRENMIGTILYPALREGKVIYERS